MAAWGFAYKTHVAWVKNRIGTGFWLRNKRQAAIEDRNCLGVAVGENGRSR
jgi:N6-adenosine-specific RNA methylase IME4